ncbi:MAG TPA: PepSY domain-containing protein [Bradyrhizobium sp.]|nr:PepSY domain-containing protein [Bradyrhizobium sp.]
MHRILLLLILCTVTSALAQRAPEPDVQVTEKEIKSFETAKVSVAEAIRIAAKKYRDAKVVDVSFDNQGGQLAYKVKTYQENNVWEGAVDAWTGQIIGEGTTTPVSKLDEEDQLELAGLQKASIDLSAATALAEEKGSGKAISAGIEATNGRAVYEISVVKNGAVTKFVIDPKSAQIK